MKPSNAQTLILRLALAGLFLYIGIIRIRSGWLSSPDNLLGSLTGYKDHATGLQLAYIENVMMPFAPVWAKLMTLGATAIGISMLLGLLVRLFSIVGILLVINDHFLASNLFSLSFFGNPWAALLLAALLAVFLARGGRWAGFDTMLAKSKPKSILW